jgi:hypothetical protein
MDYIILYIPLDKEVHGHGIRKSWIATVLWLRQLAASLTPQGPRFNPRSVHTQFVVDKVALAHTLLLLVSVYHCCVLVHSPISDATVMRSLKATSSRSKFVLIKSHYYGAPSYWNVTCRLALIDNSVQFWHIQTTGAGGVSSSNKKGAGCSDLMYYSRLDIHFATQHHMTFVPVCRPTNTECYSHNQPLKVDTFNGLHMHNTQHAADSGIVGVIALCTDLQAPTGSLLYGLPLTQ